MLQYDSFSISSGNSARLYTPALDLAAYGASLYEVAFMMHHDTGYSSSDDRVEIQVSNDASTWTTVGSVSRYDGTTGWAEHEIDISAYASESNLYVGFLGVSAYGNSIYVDDITVQARLNPIVEFDETQYVDIESGKLQYVLFSYWEPQTPRGTTIVEYQVDVCTELIIDGNTGNDCYQDDLLLLYGDYDDASVLIEPELWYVFWANAIPLPWNDDPTIPRNGTIYLGDFVGGNTVYDVDTGSILINEQVVPHTVNILPYHENFTGEVLEIIFPIPEFLGTYSPIWDVTAVQYIVSGDFTSLKDDGGESFSVSGDVSIRGHSSGDMNLDTKTNIADMTYLIGYLFGGTSAPKPSCTGDLNNDGSIDISDITYYVSYLFGSGPAPSKQSCDPVW